MKWVPDRTGRFPQRPHYDPAELDAECESIVGAYLRKRYDAIAYPLTTNDLTILLEQHVADLDLYSDLTDEGDDVEGVTEFVGDGKPKVKVDRRLTEQHWRENRLRTTLAHEFGHVRFHTFLWASVASQPRLIAASSDNGAPKCRRDSMINALPTDWMEWQAGYVSGALLMPASGVRKAARQYLVNNNLHAPVDLGSPQGQALIDILQHLFQVSQDAARVRLAKLEIGADRVPASSHLPL